MQVLASQCSLFPGHASLGEQNTREYVNEEHSYVKDPYVAQYTSTRIKNNTLLEDSTHL